MRPVLALLFLLLSSCGPKAQRSPPPQGDFTAKPLPPSIRFRRLPPKAVTPGQPILTWVAPNYHDRPAPDLRPQRYPSNVHYEPVRRYRMGSAPGPRFAVSPDGRGVVIAPGRPDDVIVLSDIDDPKSERVVHLGRPPKTTAIWRGYRAHDVAWCGGEKPTIYVAAGHAIWALDSATLETLPGWPIARRAWSAACVKGNAVAVSEGIYGSKATGATGSVTVFERSGTQRFSTWVSRYPPYAIASTNTGLLVSESERGLVVLDPQTGAVLHEVTSTGPRRPMRPPMNSFSVKFRGRLAVAPDIPEITISVEPVVGEEQPLRARLPEFNFAPFPSLDELRAIDKRLADDDSVRTESRGYNLQISNVNAIAYSPDGRTIAMAGSTRTPRSWTASVIWVLRDGKLYDTLEGHHGTGTDVKVLPDGRIVSISSAGAADLFVWAPKKPSP